MNQDEVNTTLEEFCRKYLSPPAEEREVISKHYSDLQEILGNEIFQSGSYVRETSVTPVHDLDIIWILPEAFQVTGSKLFSSAKQGEPFYFDVKDPLQSLASILAEGYRKIGEEVEIDADQTHSVSIAFPKEKGFSIDVVPALKSGRKNRHGDDIYLVPEIQKMHQGNWAKKYSVSGGKIPWILSDPKGYIKQALNLNSNPSYRKSVKFAKVWKKSCNAGLTEFELKSFHFELVITNIFAQNKGINFYDTVCYFLKNMGQWLEKPAIPDMAESNIFVDSYLNEDKTGVQRKLAVDFASKALSKFVNMPEEEREEVYSALRESLIANPPWPFAPNPSKINVSCKVKRSEKVKNPPSFKNIPKPFSKFQLEVLNGTRSMTSGEYLSKDYSLYFSPDINGLVYDEIRWLVVNNGLPALEMARIGGWRGNEFHFCEGDSDFKEEHTQYPGMHWVDCYAINKGVCVATGRFYVGIKDE
ncbi:hypothetical protein C4578_00750 [Candidatus Microgenomates bacterium]|jgi:hypothetical protein|nr:MAG: hypothetical protein C4578_00750 [Candidatus Microgenomates bacterium]